MARKLTKILDKLVQVGPSYLDQTLRSYVTENKEYRIYEDKPNDPDANTYAVFSFFSSGIFKAEEPRIVDILLVGGGGGGSVGNMSGGSGGGNVVEIKKCLLPSGTYKITVGAGGAGGVNNIAELSGGNHIADAQGGVGNPTIFQTISGLETITAQGGGTGGLRKTDIAPTAGGCGGGAGGVDDAALSPAGATTTSDAATVGYTSDGYFRGDPDDGSDPIFSTTSIPWEVGLGEVTIYGEPGGNSDTVGADATNTYSAGGGGGAGQPGEDGIGDQAGNGGDGISIDWVNEVFNRVYKFNGDVYWAAGGGGAGAANKEPGNGGRGGGGGGGGYNDTGSTPNEVFRNGKRGELGFNEGYDAYLLKGGAGGQNTGSGAGGTSAVGAAVSVPYNLADLDALLQGNNGGSGFALIRVHMKEYTTP